MPSKSSTKIEGTLYLACNDKRFSLLQTIEDIDFSIVRMFVTPYRERDFMTSLSADNQADIIEAFNSTSRYLDELLNINNPYFKGMVNQIYPPELQLNRTSDTEAPFWIYIYLFLMVSFPPKFMINAMTLILIV